MQVCDEKRRLLAKIRRGPGRLYIIDITIARPICLVTGRDRKVIDFTRYRIKNNSKLTNLMKMYRIEGYNGK